MLAQGLGLKGQLAAPRLKGQLRPHFPSTVAEGQTTCPWGYPRKGVQDGFCTSPAVPAHERLWPRLMLLKAVLATQQPRQEGYGGGWCPPSPVLTAWGQLACPLHSGTCIPTLGSIRQGFAARAVGMDKPLLVARPA